VQIGRIIDYLEESGQLDNTIIFYCADNGASGEGSPNGSVNENKFFNMYPDDIKANLAMIDRLGGPDTYNHYPTGWAVFDVADEVYADVEKHFAAAMVRD
jgi:arylsulfatase A-like enzyme